MVLHTGFPRNMATKCPTAAASCAYWLLKSEPSDYSIAMMASEGRTVWDGVRNVVARKNLRAMAIGDQALFYHSSCTRVGIVGLVAVAAAAYPDPTDDKWAVVDVRHVETWDVPVSLEDLKKHKDGALEGMALFRQPRLSVQPVSRDHFAYILTLRDSQTAAVDGPASVGAPSAVSTGKKRARKAEPERGRKRVSVE